MLKVEPEISARGQRRRG